MRLFLFPGLYHCGGGDGFADFDVLSPLMAWVETGAAPDRIVAVHGGGLGMAAPLLPRSPATVGVSPPPADVRYVVRRPIFAYPMSARYVGRGAMSDPANWVAAPGATADQDRVEWEGARFMTPDFHVDFVVRAGRAAPVASN